MEQAPKRLSRMLLLLLCRLPQSVRCWNRTTRRQLDEQQQPNGVHTVPRWCVRVCERRRAAGLMNDCATALYGRVLLGGRQGGQVPAVSAWHPSLPAAPPHPDLSLTSAVRLRFLHACAQRHAQACEVCCNALPARRSTFGFVTRFLLACAWTVRVHQLRQHRRFLPRASGPKLVHALPIEHCSVPIIHAPSRTRTRTRPHTPSPQSHPARRPSPSVPRPRSLPHPSAASPSTTLPCIGTFFVHRQVHRCA